MHPTDTAVRHTYSSAYQSSSKRINTHADTDRRSNQISTVSGMVNKALLFNKRSRIPSSGLLWFNKCCISAVFCCCTTTNHLLQRRPDKQKTAQTKYCSTNQTIAAQALLLVTTHSAGTVVWQRALHVCGAQARSGSDNSSNAHIAGAELWREEIKRS